MQKFDVTEKSKRIHAIYAAFDVSRAVAYDTDIVSEYLRRLNNILIHGNIDQIPIFGIYGNNQCVNYGNNESNGNERCSMTSLDMQRLEKYMKTKPSKNGIEAPKQMIHTFLSKLKEKDISHGRACNLQSLFVPAVGFAMGKYFGTCMDEMLVNFYTQKPTELMVPNMQGSHFFVNKPSNTTNLPKKHEIFLKLVFPGVFRHIFCKHMEDTTNQNRNCANAKELVWLLERVLKQTSLTNDDKERLRAYLILRTKNPLAKRQRRRR